MTNNDYNRSMDTSLLAGNRLRKMMSRMEGLTRTLIIMSKAGIEAGRAGRKLSKAFNEFNKIREVRMEGRLVSKFMEFLGDQPFTFKIHKGWFECNGGAIVVKELEGFLQGIYRQGQKDLFTDPWTGKFREMIEDYYKE